tara:strand:+ start:376 stop:546 length:171 start_codon:yes stop_codon:yes gene_type:complete
LRPDFFYGEALGAFIEEWFGPFPMVADPSDFYQDIDMLIFCWFLKKLIINNIINNL